MQKGCFRLRVLKFQVKVLTNSIPLSLSSSRVYFKAINCWLILIQLSFYFLLRCMHTYMHICTYLHVYSILPSHD